MKVLFDFLIDSFGLAIGLRMVSGGEIRLYSSHSVEISHELCRELGALVADGFSWKTEFCPDMITIDTSGTKCREFHVCREGDNVFGESVDNYDDGVVSGRFGKWSDEVNGDVFPGGIGDCVGV